MAKIKRPAFITSLTEPHRAAAELLTSRLPFLLDAVKNATPEGDGHPVMVLQGFLAPGKSTVLLQRFLEQKGYVVYDSGIDWNVGVTGAQTDQIEGRFTEIFDQHGGQKISLVGHSLGGVSSLYLAYKYPDMVRHVVTMGSPIGTAVHDGGVAGLAKVAFERVSDAHREEVGAFLAQEIQEAAPVAPVTSIFSYGDGVASADVTQNHWNSHDEAENLRVPGSHVGMIFNPLVYLIIADRLAQDEGVWRPFDRRDYPAVSVLLKKRRSKGGGGPDISFDSGALEPD